MNPIDDKKSMGGGDCDGFEKDGGMMEKDTHFRQMEYESLRREIETISKELRETEKYAVLINSAIWVWLGTESGQLPQNLAAWIWWLPVLVVALGGTRFIGVKKSLEKIADYIATEIEPKFLPEGQGWENHLRTTPTRAYKTWWASSLLLWAVLLLVSLSIAVYMGSRCG